MQVRRNNGAVMEFYGLPPIGQKQERPVEGAQFHSQWVGGAVGLLSRKKRLRGSVHGGDARAADGLGNRQGQHGGNLAQFGTDLADSRGDRIGELVGGVGQ